jgi:FMN phosphatase YigB (HAD superfamily)
MLDNFGFDLDNTLIDYSNSVKKYCYDNSLVFCKNIKELRKLLRKKDDSGNLWIQAQSWLYTEGLTYAKPAVGAGDICEYLKDNKYTMFIVSHKSSHTPDLVGRKPLRTPVAEWLSNSLLNNYFKKMERVYFETTRDLKVRRIKELKLGYFVDDLIEVFQEPLYPKSIRSFLISEVDMKLSWVQSVPNLTKVQEIIANDK